MRIFSGIQPTGAEAPRQLRGRLPSVRRDAGAGRGVLLHRRPPFDQRRVRPGGPARAHARPLRDADRDRARSGSLDDLRAEPRDGARRGQLAALVGDELRPARPDDAVQGEVRVAGVRVGGPLHLSRAAGGRHPALPDRHRPGRDRPAAAHRAHARRGRALQLPLRRDLHAAAWRLPRGRGEDHGPAGAREEDVDDRRHRAGHGLHPRLGRTRSGASSRSRSPTRGARSSTPRTSPACRTSSRS